MEKMYKDGGLATDGIDVDPVSGNNIPIGSNAEDVRDNVDAKLSTGEYIVPADVVKYLGVAQLEKLVNKAKDGLEDMAEDGRIGGEPTEDEMPMNLDGYAAGGAVEGIDYNSIFDRIKAAAVKDPSITNMMKAKGIFIQEPQPKGDLQQAAMSGGAVPVQAAPPALEGKDMPTAFAEGGLVYGQGQYSPTNYGSSYNPYTHTPGFSGETGMTGQAPGTPYQPAVAEEVPVCPEGYVWDPKIKVCMPVEATAPTSDRDRGGRGAPTQQQQSNPNAWMEKYDYSNPETLFNQSMTTLGSGPPEGDEEEESSWLGSLGDAAKGLLSGGLAGGLIGKFMNTNKSAQVAANAITLRSMGREDLADQLEAQNNTFVENTGLNLVPSSWRDGDRLAARIEEEKGDLWSTDATQRVSTNNQSASTSPQSRPVYDVASGRDNDSRPSRGSTVQFDRGSDSETEGTRSAREDANESAAAAAGVTDNAPTTSTRPSVRPTRSSSVSQETTDARESAARAAERDGTGLNRGGRATGGLVGRPPKSKAKPAKKTPTGKRGLGRK
jgi:hypothetical protein